jgi:hypothetical protein
MTPEMALDQPRDDLEGLIRLAGDYVQASDDLRPRVLEAAKAASRERRARRRIMQIAAVILVAIMPAATYFGGSLQPSAAQASLWPLQNEPAAGGKTGDACWEVVDSFTELRRYQARVLRLAL